MFYMSIHGLIWPVYPQTFGGGDGSPTSTSDVDPNSSFSFTKTFNLNGCQLFLQLNKRVYVKLAIFYYLKGAAMRHRAAWTSDLTAGFHIRF